MIEKSELSKELYRMLLKRGYPEPFCDQVTQNLNTDFTAKRMIGYLRYNDNLPIVEIVDEMLAILEDRKRIIEKMETERANAAYNEFLNRKREEE